MDKLMKKIAILGLMTLGVMAAAKAPAFANDYETSTWTARFVQYVSTRTDPSVTPKTVGGVLESYGTVDISRVWLSSGTFGGSAYFVCVDSLPLTAITGGVPAYNIANFPNEQYLFPPVQFVASTSTIISGIVSPLTTIDFRDYQGGGRTVKNGITCFVLGDTTNRYWWTLETVETPSATERR